MRSLTRSSIASVALAVVVVATSPASAGELRNQAGLTPYQRSMAAAIDAVCPRLVAATASLDATQTDLRLRCTEMRQTANALQGSGATVFSLGLSSQELADALGRLAPEEVGSQSQLGSTPGRTRRGPSARG